MQCNQCGYQLWNLRSRTCPECGKQFKPSEYEFAQGTVAFCCPHCDQDYYGTTAVGHLYPASFNCAKCSTPITMDEMVLRPTEGLEDHQTQLGKIPWMRRSEIGRFRALLKTISMAAFRPSELGIGRALDTDEGQSAASFVAIVSGVLVLSWFMFQFSIQAFFLGIFGGPGFSGQSFGDFIGYILLGVVVSGAVMWAVTALLTLLYLWIWSLTIHVILKWSGEIKSSRVVTTRTVYYSFGANAVTAIPCVGWMIGWIWHLVSTIIAVRASQRVSTFRATIATILLPGVIGVATMVAYYFFIRLILTTGPMGMAAFPGAAGPAPTQNLLNTYYNHATTTGEYPKHIMQLVRDEIVDPYELIDSLSQTMVSNIVYPTLDVDKVDKLAPSVTKNRFDTFLENVPDDLLAHRGGDFVFYAPPEAPADSPPDRWLIVMWPDPAVSGNNHSYMMVYVGLANGTVKSFDISGFEKAFKERNEWRVDSGLPPLPHPKKVTHQKHFIVGEMATEPAEAESIEEGD